MEPSDRKKYFQQEDGFSNPESIYNEVTGTGKSQVDVPKRQSTSPVRVLLRNSFSDASEEEQDFLRQFSFICMLSFDVLPEKANDRTSDSTNYLHRIF